MLSEYERNLVEDNMHTVEIVVKMLIAKYGIPKSEYEEYCQIGYLVLCSKVGKYDGSTKFSTFANKVLRNAFIDKYRFDKARNREIISLDKICSEDANGNGASLAEFLASETDVENEVLSKITNDLVREYIKSAKERYSSQTTVKGFEALELKLDGYSGEEIAKIFDVPSNSLRSWMSRAKKLLLNEKGFISIIRG